MKKKLALVVLVALLALILFSTLAALAWDRGNYRGGGWTYRPGPVRGGVSIEIGPGWSPFPYPYVYYPSPPLIYSEPAPPVAQWCHPLLLDQYGMPLRDIYGRVYLDPSRVVPCRPQ